MTNFCLFKSPAHDTLLLESWHSNTLHRQEEQNYLSGRRLGMTTGSLVHPLFLVFQSDWKRAMNE